MKDKNVVNTEDKLFLMTKIDIHFYNVHFLLPDYLAALNKYAHAVISWNCYSCIV